MRRIAVRTSLIHGRGVFALTNLAAGDPIIEYKGEIITAREAQRRVDRSRAEDGHTFFFNLEDGRMIDGAQGGNSARWINHRDLFFCRKPLTDHEPDSAIVISRGGSWQRS